MQEKNNCQDVKEDIIFIEDNLKLVVASSAFASAIFEAIDFNRENFSKYMAWPSFVKQEADTLKSLQDFYSAHQKNASKTYVILYFDKVVGVVGFNNIDKGNKVAEIGYWLDSRSAGNGIVTKAVLALVKYYQTGDLINRFVIKCSVANSKSNAVAKRCGFTLEGRLRKAEYLNGIFYDQNIYSWLAEDSNK
ncbi:GNAT family N-acetyltransferase [Bartonella sp. DGB1]|uniref:GNAT family N-acetyltransferase n=1 Tax=Bartonella sp. DGB1 TaxID=3239807 RepID=UPI0035243E35